MARRKVIWTKTADLQFQRILEYWVDRNQSTNYARKLINDVATRTIQISQNPGIFKKTDYGDVRVASLGNFSIYYRTYPKSIAITAFWDNRQDPNKLLKLIKKNRDQ